MPHVHAPATRAVILTLAASFVLSGCSRHLDVLDAGPAQGPDSALVVDIEPARGPRPEGLLVEIYRRDTEALATRFTTSAAGPHTIPDMPPGEYVIHVDARPIGAGILKEDFDVARGRAVAIVYDDNAAARASAGRTAVQVARVTGIVLLVAAAIAIDLILIVGSRGHCGFVCCRVVLGR